MSNCPTGQQSKGDGQMSADRLDVLAEVLLAAESSGDRAAMRQVSSEITALDGWQSVAYFLAGYANGYRKHSQHKRRAGASETN